MPGLNELSRRERQIMDIILKHHEVTAAEVHEQLPDQPTYSTVRALLAVLVKKGYVRHRRDGRAYRYSARINRDKAGRTALKNVVHTFFDDSIEDVVATLVSMKSANLSDDDIKRLEQLIRDKAGNKGKKS